jgi:hypothetical protein
METETMKPGDVRIFKPHRSVILAVGVFAKRQGKCLRIDITGSGKHTTVESNPNPERYHRTFFAIFADNLSKMDAGLSAKKDRRPKRRTLRGARGHARFPPR